MVLVGAVVVDGGFKLSVVDTAGAGDDEELEDDDCNAGAGVDTAELLVEALGACVLGYNMYK